MKVEIIKAIFTNLLFVIGIVLLIIGAGKAVSTTVKLLVFDSYPLPSYEEQQCEFQDFRTRPVMEDTPEPQETDPAMLERCLENLEKSRQLRLVEDVSQATVMLISGVALVLIFRQFIFDRHLAK